MYRIKTEAEFISEYGPEWKQKVDWSSYGGMDYLFGREVHSNLLHTIDEWAIFPKMIKAVDSKDKFKVIYFGENKNDGKFYSENCPYIHKDANINSIYCREHCRYSTKKKLKENAVGCTYSEKNPAMVSYNQKSVFTTKLGHAFDTKIPDFNGALSHFSLKKEKPKHSKTKKRKYNLNY